MATSQGVNVRPTPSSIWAAQNKPITQTSATDLEQVLRWSALAAGIFYGFSHQRTITANSAAAKEKAAYDHKLDLISKAKAEWAKKNIPVSAKTTGGDGEFAPSLKRRLRS
jgi:F-type H+-transporting ATP synthase subunit e